MPEIELPRLTSAELVARFGGDEPAMRRYRMLAALLREGRPAGEVARTFGVSRESLRRLRQAFQRGGIAALQSRKRGGGHVARGSPLVRAIRQELSADPGVPASILWRRVQARLRDQGFDAPRSTFYRLLAQMRDEESGAAGERMTIGLLREALGDLVETPPLALGRSELAGLLLGGERDPLRRGRWLQEALRAAIGRLRPAAAGPVLDDPHWRHYLIIAGEYEAGEDRTALQAALALSASTYSRAKREAMERMLALLPGVLDELQPPESSSALIAPPPPPDALDHEPELEQYAARLRRGGLALIWGPPGVGKHEVAAALAARLQTRGQRVVWHACRAPEAEPNAGARLLATLAAALALDNMHELRDLLVASEPGQPRRIELLESALAGRRWTVILVNIQWLIGDEAARALGALRAAQERRDIRLVLVGDELPAWADPRRWPSLPFVGDAAARRAFLSDISGEPPRPADQPPIEALREKALDLAGALPDHAIAALDEAQAEQLLAVLRPLEERAAALRQRLRAAAAPGDRTVGLD